MTLMLSIIAAGSSSTSSSIEFVRPRARCFFSPPAGRAEDGAASAAAPAALDADDPDRAEDDDRADPADLALPTLAASGASPPARPETNLSSVLLEDLPDAPDAADAALLADRPDLALPTLPSSAAAAAPPPPRKMFLAPRRLSLLLSIAPTKLGASSLPTLAASALASTAPAMPEMSSNAISGYIPPRIESSSSFVPDDIRFVSPDGPCPRSSRVNAPRASGPDSDSESRSGGPAAPPGVPAEPPSSPAVLSTSRLRLWVRSP
mmetsp:Transcript_32292/g.73782  ORF Transcript_32292/g.73782 Transcript_32292/m.73782 type:complete len:264 (-) Transcript_32292:827-1618(-)